MKKIYLSLLSICFVAGVSNAQRTMSIAELGDNSAFTVKPVKNNENVEKAAVYWTEDFSNGMNSTNGMWTTSGVDGSEWKHSFYTTSGTFSTGTSAFASTTASNGFMLWDEDSLNTAQNGSNPGNWGSHTGELISPQIDLSTYPNVVLQLEQDFRYCCATSHNLTVSISTNGGSTWGAPIDLTEGAGSNDPFLTINGSYVIQKNITSQAGGQMINLKFSWDGNTSGDLAYYWAIDDISIVEWPADDNQLKSAWFVGENNEGVEYGRTPEDMQDANYYVGASVYNFGMNTQTSNVLSVDVNSGTYMYTSNDPSIPSDSTHNIESLETPGYTMGTYTANYSVVSANETAASPEYYNNTGVREFEITSATPACTEYSLDGIDVYTNPSLGSLGTNSFTGGEDGLVLAGLYHIKSTTSVSGLRVMLSSATVAGGEIYGSIKDTSLWFQNDMTPLFQTAGVTVSSGDISNGYVDLWFSAPVTLNQGAYYAAVELYSNANTNDIRVLNDKTVDEPWYASMIYLPGDQVYSNGDAIGVRMLMGNCNIGLDEASLPGVSVYPNPSEGMVTVTNEQGLNNTIVVYDLAGRVVLTKNASATTTIDLTSVKTGTYLVKVTNDNGSITEHVVIK